MDVPFRVRAIRYVPEQLDCLLDQGRCHFNKGSRRIVLVLLPRLAASYGACGLHY